MNNNPINSFWEGIRPTPLLKVSEWADKFRRLSSEASAEFGQWRTSRTPYLKEILDNLSPTSPYQEIVVQKAVQLGFTESGLNAAGCYIDIAPCPILYVMPTIEMAKGLSKSRIDTMIEASPTLSTKIPPARQRDGGNTVLTKEFPGGVLVLAGANSGSSLRSRPIRLLVLDEIDAYPLSVDDEGSPISLAEKRTVTFSNRKIYKLSTPINEGSSAIARAIEETDKRKYFVPCPFCGVLQTLEFKNLKWDKSDYDSVHYECSECSEKIPDRYKTEMLENGEWRATDKSKVSTERAGYIINGLYSPVGWMSWKKIAQEFEETKDNQTLLKTFINTVLGETWKEKGEAPPYENLYNRREAYRLNKPQKEICFITVGVDVQRDRLELEIVGWCKAKRSYSIDYRTIPGDTAGSEVWAELSKVVTEQWEREDGLMLPMKLMAVDTGFNTNHVYEFCRKQDASRVIPIKGSDKQQLMVTAPRQVDVTRSGKKIGKVKVWMVGVSLIKSELYGWLRLERAEDGTAPAGYCHFPQYDMHYFKGLAGEELQVKLNKRGYREYQWVKKYDRNEPLDCRVYARAAAAVVGIDRFTDEQMEQMAGLYRKPESSKKEKKRTSFWDN